MSENKVFCQNCKEEDCLISLDNTCEMIRVYKTAKEKNNCKCMINDDLTQLKGLKFSIKEPTKTPNCGICKCRGVIVETKTINICMAQAYRPVDNCYNTPECQKLFTENNDE